MSEEPEKHDLGEGFSYSFFTEKNTEGSTGLIICGPAAPQCHYAQHFDGAQCRGGVHFTNSTIGQKEGRPLWKVESLDPLTISPSIVCKCGGQHGWIRNGRYEKA